MTVYLEEPWLCMDNVDKFAEYISEIKYPLQALETPRKKENILNGILKLSENHNNLFNDNKDEIKVDLERLVSMKTKCLYRQWQKEIKGKKRTLSIPNPELEIILKKYVKNIILNLPTHKKAYGGEPGWSTAKMIRMHTPIGSVLSCDIYHAFESVKSDFVFEFYYNIAAKYFSEEISKDTAGFLTTISTVDYHNRDNSAFRNYYNNALPQGSPVSMALFNRMLYPIDIELEKLCQKNKLQYSRWVDDIIITSPILQKDNSMMTIVLATLRENYAIPVHKVFFQNKAPFYILGQDIKDEVILKSQNNIAKNARQSVEEYYYNTSNINRLINA